MSERRARRSAAMRKFVLFAKIILILFAGILIVVVFVDERATSSLSPNGEYRISVWVIKPRFIDLRFTVVVEDVRKGTAKTIYRSPDEGGTGRFIWAPDSSQVLLVGKGLSTIDGVELANGEKLYLLYDISKDVVFCNASQLKTCENFGMEEAKSIVGEDIQVR